MATLTLLFPDNVLYHLYGKASLRFEVSSNKLNTVWKNATE